MKNDSGKSPKGRPKQDAAAIQKKKLQIIDAAKHLFNEEGYESVSMRKIAAQAGMGAMTLYQYFPKKIDILHHIWGEFFLEIFQRIAHETHKQRSANKKLKTALTVYLNYWFEYPDRFRMVFLNEDRSDTKDEFFIEKDDNVLASYNQMFDQVVMEVFPENTYAKNQVIAQSLICMVHGIALNLITISEFSWREHSKLLDAYISTLLNE